MSYAAGSAALAPVQRKGDGKSPGTLPKDEALTGKVPARDPYLRAAQCLEGVQKALQRPVLKLVPTAVQEALLTHRVATWDELDLVLRGALAEHMPPDDVPRRAAVGVDHVRAVGRTLREIAAAKVDENEVVGPQSTRLEGLDINRFTTVSSAISHVQETYEANLKKTGQLSLFGAESVWEQVEKQLQTNTLLRELQDLQGVSMLVKYGIIPLADSAELATQLVGGRMRTWKQFADFLNAVHGKKLTGEELAEIVAMFTTMAQEVAAKRFFDRQEGANLGVNPLVVASNPMTQSQSLLKNVDVELAGIKESTPEAALAANVTPDELDALLAQKRSSMLWYSGHADADGLSLNSGDELATQGAEDYSADRLVDNVKGAGLDLVGLNACQTEGIAERLANETETTTIGTATNINDEKAGKFGTDMMRMLSLEHSQKSAMSKSVLEQKRKYGGSYQETIVEKGEVPYYGDKQANPYGMFMGGNEQHDSMTVGLKQKRAAEERAKRERKVKTGDSVLPGSEVDTLEGALEGHSLADLIRVCGIVSDFADEHAAALMAEKPRNMALAQRFLMGRYVVSLVADERYDGPVAARFGLISRDDHARFLVYLRHNGVKTGELLGPLAMYQRVKEYRQANPTLFG